MHGTSRPGAAALVGRGPELERLSAMLDALASGRGGVLVITGEPGIGKTTLLDWVAGRAVAGTDAMVVGVAGFEAEQELAHAALDTLRRRLAAAGVRVPEPHAAVPEAATGDGPTPSPLAIGNATLASITAGRRPLVLLVDDAQWIDAPSAMAIAFALRRVGDEPVLALVAHRPGHRTPFTGQDLDALVLDGLGVTEAAVLLGTGTTAEVAARCVEATAGNPLGLVELARTLDSDQRAGRAPLPAHAHAGGRLVEAFASRVPALPSRTRRALALVAATADGPALDLAAALAGDGGDVDDLVPAETAGLVTLGDGRVAFVHPLMRTAVREAVGPAAMRDAHARLAAVVVDVERRAWHLTAAATGPDETAAKELARAAAIASSRGAPALAAETWQRSADLSVDPERRIRRLVRAATAWWDGCDAARAMACAREVVRTSTDPVARADATGVLAEAIGWHIDSRDAVRALVDGARDIAPVDGDRAAVLLIRATLHAGLGGRPVEALWCAERALQHSTPGTPMEVAVRTVRALSAQRRGATATAASDLAMAASLTDLPVEVLGRALGPLQAMALTYLAREEWDDARRVIDAALGAARRHGLDGARYFTSALLAELLVRQGRLVDALLAPGPLDAIDSARPAPTVPVAMAITARAEAWLGRADEARAHAEQVQAVGRRVGLGALEAWAGSALGHLALVEGRPDEAVRHLRRVHEVHAEVLDPGELWFQADLGEALFDTGDRDAAADLAVELASQAERTRSRWGRTAALRVGGLVHGDVVALRASAEVAAELGAPLEEARALLVLAERFGDEAAGRRALAAFERCAASAWAARARRSIGGGRATDADDAASAGGTASLSGLLSDAELRVAVAVARGRSNRQVADELFISPRTVDAHLRRIYAKLGIRSRAQLAVLVVRQLG